MSRPRLQSSIAASAGAGWVVFNASPDIRAQIAATRELQPAAGAPLRSTPIAAVVLTNADVDHLAGLLSLRERQPFHLYASGRVLDVLAQNSIFRVLDPAYVRRIELPVDQEIDIEGPDGPTGLRIMLYPVPGKVALFLETGDAGQRFQCGRGRYGWRSYLRDRQRWRRALCAGLRGRFRSAEETGLRERMCCSSTAPFLPTTRWRRQAWATRPASVWAISRSAARRGRSRR